MYRGWLVRSKGFHRPEWNANKPDWQWLFPFIDTDRNGTINSAEYVAFQQYKAKHPDRQTQLQRKQKERSVRRLD